jgi:peptide/nickel transport system ATP-binding protein
MFLLEVNGLSCHDASGRRQVLRDVTFGIEPRSTLGLLGGSGAGKSTLARCIVGLQPVDSGTIVFDGKEIISAASLQGADGSAIQMVFQSSTGSLNPVRSVYETLVEAVEAAGIPPGDWPEAVHSLLTAVGLSAEHLRRRPDQLSGGQRQRVGIARTLAVRPRLLILDEPTSALDLITQARVLSLLRSLQNEYGFAILFITQDVRLALSLCDRIAILHEGTIVEEGEPARIAHNPRHDYTHHLIRFNNLMSEGAA